MSTLAQNNKNRWMIAIYTVPYFHVAM